MNNSPPASPEELRVPVQVYRKQKIKVDDDGQEQVKYVLRKELLFKESRQKSTSANAVHVDSQVWFSRFIGNWWEMTDIETTDIFLVLATNVQFGLAGPVVNWEERNRWGIVDCGADMTCHKLEQDVCST